jgi:hypothetical protein
VTALAKSVHVDGVIYAAGTDHSAMPARVVDEIRNGGAWVGGVAPPLSAVTVGKPRLMPGDLTSADKARTAIGAVAVNEAPLTPLRYGAKGDGVTLDDAAFAAMWADLPAVGGHVYLPSNRDFRLTQPLLLHSGLRIEGGDRRRALITNTVSSVFTIPGSRSDMHFHDFGVVAGFTNGSGGGHIFDFSGGEGFHGPYCSTWNNLYLFQKHPGKSIFHLPSGQYLDNQVRDCWFVGNGRTVPMIYLRSTTGSLSDNLWTDMRIDDVGTPTTWAMWVEEASTTTALGNTFQRLNFENPAGGAICLRGQNGADLRQIWLWDMHTVSTNHLILLDRIVGIQPNTGVTLEKIARPGGAALGSGLADIYGAVGNHVGTTVRRCVTDGGQPLRVDLAYSPGQRVEDCYGAGVSIQSYVFGATIGAGAGTGAVISTKAGGYYEGNVVINSGTGPSAGTILTVFWPNGLRSAPAAVTLTAMTTTAVDAGLYVTNLTASGFEIAARNALPASTAGIRFAFEARTAVTG